MATTLLTSGITMGSSTLSPSGTAPSYTCRAWVNFNGQGTVAIGEDGNVSSITDNGVGQYTINFTTAMSDANYAAVGATGTIDYGTHVSNYTSSSVQLKMFLSDNNSYGDPSEASLAVFR